MLKAQTLLTPEQEAESKTYLTWEHENSHRVVSFENVGPYTLRLIFDNEVEKVINFYDFVSHPNAGRMYNKLQDLDFFNQVFIDDCGMLTWPDRTDFNPAMLYTWNGESWREWLLDDVKPDPKPAEIRQRLHLTQAEFAARLRVSLRTLQEWEQGRRKPTGPALSLLHIADQEPDVFLRVR